MSLPTLFLENQFGEQSENVILGGTNTPVAAPIAANTFLGNITGSSALAAAITYANVVTQLPILTKPLTGLSAGAGTLAATDTILQGFNKLAGNTQNKAVTANVLTGLGAGSNTPIAATDTILAALANLQAQISAL